MDLSPSPTTLFESPFLISGFLVGVSSLAFGLFVLFKAPKKRLNQLWFLFSVTVAVWGFGALWGTPVSDPQVALWRWRVIGATGITWIPVLYLHFICHFLNIRRPRVLIISYLTGVIFALLYLTDQIFPRTRYLWNEIHWPLAGRLHPIYFLWWTALIFYSHWELWRAYRHCDGVRKAQIGLIFLASVIGYGCGVLEYLPDYGINLYPMSNFGVALYPFIMTYAILQYRLFDISLVVRRSLIYSVLISTLTGGYFAVIYAVESISRTNFGYQSVWLSLGAFGTMTLLFQPLKIWTQRWIDWLIFRAPHEEIVRRMERLEQQAFQGEKLKAVATIAAGMAHEIKNPLTALQTFAEFVPDRHKDPKFAKMLHETLLTETRRIRGIVQDVLDFARPKTPQVKPLDLEDLLGSTVALLSNQLLKQRVKWTIDCQHNGAVLQADHDQLRQVLINLIQNAADAMSEGGTLTLETRAENGHLLLAVSDTGTGIPKEILPKIFDPFVTTKPDGNGLGLAMVHSIIRAHHGTIHATSEPGKGTTFTVRLPL